MMPVINKSWIEHQVNAFNLWLIDDSTWKDGGRSSVTVTIIKYLPSSSATLRYHQYYKLTGNVHPFFFPLLKCAQAEVFKWTWSSTRTLTISTARNQWCTQSGSAARVPLAVTGMDEWAMMLNLAEKTLSGFDKKKYTRLTPSRTTWRICEVDEPRETVTELLQISSLRNRFLESWYYY